MYRMTVCQVKTMRPCDYDGWAVKKESRDVVSGRERRGKGAQREPDTESLLLSLLMLTLNSTR